VSLFVGRPAYATPFTDLSDLGAGPGNYAILDLGGGVVNLSNVYVTGNVGVYNGSSISNMAPSTISGNVFEYSAGQYSGPGAYTGMTTINPTLMSQNRTGALNAAANADALVATQTFANISAATTITGVAGLNVIDINGNINLNNASLTLNGPANAYFVINVTGNLALGGTGGLMISGGVTTSDVLYNFTSANASLATHIGNVVNGIILAAGTNPSYSRWCRDVVFDGGLGFRSRLIAAPVSSRFGVSF
jgi:choice-of-anchor A domain-containing protein